MPPWETPLWAIGIIGLLAYTLGSVAFGPVMARVFGLGDLRSVGSGNIGATNVLRTGHRGAAFLTLVCDAGKGAFAVGVARLLAAEDAAQAAGFAAFLGHCYPVFLAFRGGKGVATFLGTLLALAWPVGLAACAAWLLVAVVSRISSLAALMSAAAAPVFAIVLGHAEVSVLCLLLAALVIARHRANIARLSRGEEPRIGKTKR